MQARFVSESPRFESLVETEYQKTKMASLHVSQLLFRATFTAQSTLSPRLYLTQQLPL